MSFISVTTCRSCSKNNIKLKTVPASIIKHMPTDAEVIVNSDAILKGFRDIILSQITQMTRLKSFVMSNGFVICKNKTCYRFPTLKICQHWLAVLIKKTALETFVKEKSAGKRREKRQKNKRAPQIKKYVPIEKVVYPVKWKDPALSLQLIHFQIVMF